MGGWQPPQTSRGDGSRPFGQGNLRLERPLLPSRSDYDGAVSRREPRVWFEPYGSSFMMTCADCGPVEQVSDAAWHHAWDHQRYDHPTEQERIDDDLRRAEDDLPGCSRCGHNDHASAACPYVRPDMLKQIDG